MLIRCLLHLFPFPNHYTPESEQPSSLVSRPNHRIRFEASNKQVGQRYHHPINHRKRLKIYNQSSPRTNMEAFIVLVAEKIGFALSEEASKAAGSLLRSEVLLLRRINVSMGRIKSELEHIRAFLDGVDTRRYNKTVEPWLKRVREIAHKVEDVIDEYTYLTSEQSQFGFIYRTLNKIVNIRSWESIASRLKQIEDDLAHATILKERYDIKKLDFGVGSSSSMYVDERESHPANLSYAVDDDQIVGMIQERKTLIKWLTDEVPTYHLKKNEVPTPFIISVWGMGGLGKTTLVNNAYESKEIENYFHLQVWVSVSQSFQDIDLLRRILKGFLGKEKTHEVESLDFASLAKKARDFLQGKRYLIVLDDVWHPNAFFDLQHALFDHKLGSKIVITTRIHEVASLADEQRRMELTKLNQNEAWDLFCKKAFWRDYDRECPEEIKEWGQKIVDKCEGLPLAIVAIARVMSLRRKTEAEWKHVYERLSWEFTDNPALDSVKHILNLSYDDLPSYLKNCFLYCSIFPEDHGIQRKRLIRLWVAEGFVEARGAQTMEEVAEDLFSELIHRCMLQIVERNNSGMVKTCRMHDLVRELTLTVARKENFSMVWARSQSERLDNIEARRLTVHDYPAEGGWQTTNLACIRSLAVFDSVGSPSSLLSAISSSNARFLRVVDLQYTNINKLPDEVGNLFNLHYLSLRNTKIHRLPNSLGRLRNLQTLDVRGTDPIERLPKGITRLKNLRHLLTRRWNSGYGFDWFSYLPAPKGLWNLTCLQSLEIAAADKELVGRLGNLTKLRGLTISRVRGNYCRQLCASLSRMPSLNKLSIRGYDEDEELPFQEFGAVIDNVKKLHLHGRLVERVAETHGLLYFLGDKIRDLQMCFSGFKEDPLEALARLSNLTSLCLRNAYNGERLCFLAGWFPKLRVLSLFDFPYLSRIKMENGSAQSLEYLELGRLPKLEEVPEGIEFQASLEKLYLAECNPVLVQMIKGEQRRNVEHIPTITLAEKRDGRWVVVEHLK